MVNDAGIATCGAAGKSTGVLGSAACATLVPGISEEVNVGSTLSGRVGAGARCETGATFSGGAVEVAEAAGCTFSCVPSEMNAGSGLLGATGITGGGGGGGSNATGVKGTTGSTGATGGGATTGGVTGVGAGATNETGAAGATGATGVEEFCTGAAFTGASGVTTGASAEITGAVSITAGRAGPSDGK